jgi:ceramide glucosyltransferase
MMAVAVFLGVAAIPFIYYLIVLVSSWRYFHQPEADQGARRDANFAPPVSILKPFRGLDPEAYENLASFCRQDYPDYELVLCIDPDDDKVRDMVEQVKRDFPQRSIRILPGSGRIATNDKVAKLARLVAEAEHEIVVISDSDVRVSPDYLRAITAPLAEPNVGAVTCFYVHAEHQSFVDRLQTAGMISDFYAGILVAWQLDGIKFALGPSIATTRSRLAAFGGYASIENRPADDLLVGRLIAEQGCEVRLLRYSVQTVSDFHSLPDLFRKRLRWIVVMRHMRPWGHFGLIFTHGLAWSLLAVFASPTLATALIYLGGYMLLRAAILWLIGVHGLHQRGALQEIALIPLWDAIAVVIWLMSFTQSSVRWRGADYYIRDGQLVPVSAKR